MLSFAPMVLALFTKAKSIERLHAGFDSSANRCSLFDSVISSNCKLRDGWPVLLHDANQQPAMRRAISNIVVLFFIKLLLIEYKNNERQGDNKIIRFIFYRTPHLYYAISPVFVRPPSRTYSVDPPKLFGENPYIIYTIRYI